MDHSIHHVPGRLRVKIPRLKGREHQAGQLAEQMGGHYGVLEARANSRTGSIVIHYDTKQIQPDSLLGMLRDSGFIGNAVVPPTLSSAKGGAQLSHKIGDIVVNKLVEKVVERSAVALIAALI